MHHKAVGTVPRSTASFDPYCSTATVGGSFLGETARSGNNPGGAFESHIEASSPLKLRCNRCDRQGRTAGFGKISLRNGRGGVGLR